ncbi:MAG: hypothetical protein ABI689_01940 [Thermoanaerobaculia bacterium]
MRPGTTSPGLKRIPLDATVPRTAALPAVPSGVEERFALAFRLWNDDCRTYAEVNGVSLEVAADRPSKAWQVGRLPLTSANPDPS